MSSIQNIDKIFVDPKEELSFLMDRIKEIDNQQVIVVIPQNSVIFASALTLRILYRLVHKLQKLVIIVTEDSYGVNISQKAGFVVVNKVSQITPDLWQVAETKKDSFSMQLQSKKNELLGIPPVKDEEDHAVNNTDDLEETETIDIDLPETGDLEKSNETVDEIVELEDVVIEEDELSDIKNIGGIKIFSGRDAKEIAENSDLSAKINKLDNFSEMNDNTMRQVNRDVFGENKFAGRDFTRSVRKKSGLNLFGFLKKKQINPEDRISDLADSSFQGPWYKRKEFIMFLSIALIILLVGYLLVFRWARASVNVFLVKQEVEAEENLRLNLEKDFGEVDLEQRVIPAVETKGDVVTESRTGTANGESKRGEKSTGFVYIFNKSNDAVKLAQGTKFTNVNTDAVYELVSETTLPAATIGDDLSTSPTRTDAVKLRAVAIGEQYNIEKSAGHNFTIDGYEGFSTLEAKQDSAFEGGTSVTFKSVSEENVKALKEKIVADLKPKALTELKLEVPTGYTLIEASVEYEEVKISSKPDIGEEVKNGNFDLSVEVLAKGLIVSDKDVSLIISTSISLTEGDEAQRNVNSLDDITFGKFVKNDSGIFLSIKAKGDVSDNLSEEEIFEIIKNKSISSATKELEKIEGIRTFEIRVYPELMPDFLKIIPSNIANVDIELK